MGYNKSPLAFEDIREVFDRALAAPRGVRVPCNSRSAAIILRSRFNYYRVLNRKENAETYPADHPMWNKSVYDKLVLRLPPKGATDEGVLYIQPRSAADLVVEEIQ